MTLVSNKASKQRQFTAERGRTNVYGRKLNLDRPKLLEKFPSVSSLFPKSSGVLWIFGSNSDAGTGQSKSQYQERPHFLPTTGAQTRLLV